MISGDKLQEKITLGIDGISIRVLKLVDLVRISTSRLLLFEQYSIQRRANGNMDSKARISVSYDRLKKRGSS
jgi:hypothetical protein